MLQSIALVGNPNSGKTTLFNRLTGANQKIGNWPGVTVEQYHGTYTDEFTRNTINVIDLPGCYSLIATADMALDEKITCEYIATAPNNTIYLNVIDAAHLSRDLYLTLQLLELGVPVIVVLNCLDLAESAGIKIDALALAKRLSCPVVPIVAKTGVGIKQLEQTLRGFAVSESLQFNYPTPIQAIISTWQPYVTAGQAVHILEGDQLLVNKLLALQIDSSIVIKQLQQTLAVELDLYIAQFRRAILQEILQQITVQTAPAKVQVSEIIDKFVLHKVFGPGIFLGVMYLLFTCAINLGGLLQIGFEDVAEVIFVAGVHKFLTSLGAAPWFINLLADGIGRGISITLTFTPVLATMFFCLGILESSGYMARAAFIVDRLMQRLGLSGKSFVPMIVGFGCNVPAVMGARTLSNQKERILTIMMTPFMSCSARLAIYAIFVAAFFPLGGQNVIFSLYLIGIMVAVLTGLILRDGMATHTESMALMDMPDYRWPLFSVLLRQVWQRLRSFLFKAGLLIIALCVVINGLGNEFLVSLGKTLTPLFAPIGISVDNWPATLGWLAGLIAKEAVVGTLNAFYVNEAAMVQYFGGGIAAYAYLLFTLLYFPCVSVVAAISKELNLRWALFSVVWSTGLAYIIAALFYQAATLGAQGSWWWILSLVLVLAGFLFIVRRTVYKTQQRQAARKPIPTQLSFN